MPYPQTNVDAFDGINVPTRADPANWNDRSEAAWASLKPGGDQMNVLAGQVNAMASAANASASAADQDRIDAQQARTDAQTARAGAEQARTDAQTARTGAETARTDAQGFAGNASDSAGDAANSASAAAQSALALTATSVSTVTIGTGNKSFAVQSGKQFAPGVMVTAVSSTDATKFVAGPVVSYNGTTLVLNGIDIGGTGSVSSWNISVTGQKGIQGIQGVPGGGETLIGRVALAANTTLTTAHAANLVDCSGTFTLAFTAAASLGTRWVTWIRNVGTGDITLDPAGSELIDGLTSYIMYPGEVRMIYCDGATFRSIVLQAFSKTFTTSGNFVKPAGYSMFEGLLWGSGGSGVKASTSYRTGGSGAACAEFALPAGAFGSTEVVAIGAGAVAVTADGSFGNNGNASTLGALVTASGGKRGLFATSGSSDAIAVGGKPYSPEVSVAHLNGATAEGATPTGAVYGAGAGAGLTNTNVVGQAGSSVFGGKGGTASITGNGGDGVAPGGGGGATESGAQSGAGARGELRIWGKV